ncbi:MAG: hypothetical protein ACJAZA_002083 [Shewanella psychromarinicola]|jgi:hypothetical protein
MSKAFSAMWFGKIADCVAKWYEFETKTGKKNRMSIKDNTEMSQITLFYPE